MLRQLRETVWNDEDAKKKRLESDELKNDELKNDESKKEIEKNSFYSEEYSDEYKKYWNIK